MNCPYCRENNTKVIESRPTKQGQRRRRECNSCDRRFTTYETVRNLDIDVVKDDGTVEPFKKEKVRAGIERAAEKTDLGEEEISEITRSVLSKFEDDRKISSEKIGQAVKEELRKKNEVAAIRFASVYENFEKAESFQQEVETIKNPRDEG